MGSSGDKMVNGADSVKVALLFPGQGSQEVGMGKDLYEKETAARWVFDRACEVLGRDIKSLCFEGPEEDLTATVNSQPSIFVTSIATLNVLVEKIKGSPVGEDGREIFSGQDVLAAGTLAMGLSLGEPTALVASGAVSFEDGLRLVEKRGFLMDEASRKEEGRMASILGLDLEKVEEICKGIGCQVANLNCPGQVVISGPASRVELAAELAKNSGARRALMLKVSGAFHSDMMAGAKEKFKEALAGIDMREPDLELISNVDAGVTKDPEKIRQNLAEQLTGRTLWESSVRNAMSKGYGDFLEIGPGSVLKGLLKKIDPSLKVTALHTSDDIRDYVSLLKGNFCVG